MWIRDRRGDGAVHVAGASSVVEGSCQVRPDQVMVSSPPLATQGLTDLGMDWQSRIAAGRTEVALRPSHRLEALVRPVSRRVLRWRPIFLPLSRRVATAASEQDPLARWRPWLRGETRARRWDAIAGPSERRVGRELRGDVRDAAPLPSALLRSYSASPYPGRSVLGLRAAGSTP